MLPKNSIPCLIFTLVICVFLTQSAVGDTIYVDGDANGANNGTTWADAYNYLQDARSAATSGDQIWVAKGIYKPDQGGGKTPGDRTAAFELKNGVEIYGGFPDSGDPNWNDREPNTHETILSGDLGGNDGPDFANNGENSYHVVTGNFKNETAVLNGFTITAGNANGISYSKSCGGGMYNESGSPTVTSCIFAKNSASPKDLCGGGGMANEYWSSPRLTNCTFSGNIVISTDEKAGGGGMFNYGYSSPMVNDCTFTGNTVISTEDLTGGGGMFNCSYSSPMVNDCTFTGNTVISTDPWTGAGGMYNYYYSSPTVNDCTFSENSAKNGGGIANVYCSPTVTNCMFIGNFVSYAGGGLVNFVNSSPTVTDCMFIGNSASFGGGMTNDGQDIDSCPKLVNCTFSGNFAQFNGAGMHNYISAKPTLTNCTFSGNKALDHGGGIHSEYKSDATLTNCILWGNEAPKGPQIAMRQNPDANASNVTISYSDVQGGQAEVYLERDCTLNWDDDSIISNDPLFLDPDGLDNEMGTEDDNLRLLFSSPCIDAGDNEADTDASTPGVQLLPPTDPDGDPRFVDDPNVVDTGKGTPPIVDMGAYEGAKGTILLVLSTESVTVPEGQTATFDVNLGMDPQETVEVTVARQSGDPNITVQSEASLTFDSFNYSVPQTVTLAADEDPDYLHGTAVISVTGAGAVSTYLTAIERDNEQPASSVLFVDKDASGANDGSSWTDAFRDLQEALNIVRYAPDVEEIRVAAGTYTPAAPLGDRTAMFELVNGVAIYGGFPSGGGEWEDRDPNIHETILSGDLNGNDKADANKDDNSYHVVTGSGTDPNTILDGLTITAGNATGPTPHNLGGGMYNESGSPTVTNCKFSGNFAEFSGGMYNYGGSPTVTDCTFNGNSADAWGGGMYNYLSSVTLSNCMFSENSAGGFAGGYDGYGGGMYNSSGSLRITNCEIDDIYGWVTDNSSIDLGSDGSITIANSLTISEDSTVTGSGSITVKAAAEMVVEDNVVVNLGDSNECNPDPNTGGHITAEGSLVVRGNAILMNSDIDVVLLDIEGANNIQYNNITLLEASTGFGGEFFVGGTSTIKCNTIISQGDRYLDLDPDPDSNDRPTITDNIITVIIKEGTLGSRGTLLELRAADYDCNRPSNPNCWSGAYQVSPNSPGFTEEPSKKWMLEKLILEKNAKLNLTNRQGFEYHDFSDPNLDPNITSNFETVYVKELVMGPNSVLNTAMQALYYQRLVDPNGVELIRDPNDPFALLANGSRFQDIPLLGFSLGIIAMDDTTQPPHNEFDIRVRRRLRDPNDIQPESCTDGNDPCSCLEGSIERIDDDPNIPADACGVMEMRTKAPGKQSASSVAAKGAFARAGDEVITVEFEYMFLDDPYDETELIVYLSDKPDVGDNLVEIARIRPPAAGRAGSIGSGRFAVFSGTFARGSLNFKRGTYVELELRGTSSRCWIDNWDPSVRCTSTCGDYYDEAGYPKDINVYDYLVLLAEFGLAPIPTHKSCLDIVADGVINTDDLMVWGSEGTHLCPLYPANSPSGSFASDATMADEGFLSTQALEIQNATESASLLIFGKPATGAGVQIPNSYLYSVDVDGTSVGDPIGPFCPGSQCEQSDGRFVTDSNGNIYQISAVHGLVRQDTETVVVEPKQNINYEGSKVKIGLHDKWKREERPLSDAVFHPDDPNIVYVVPVLVYPCEEDCHYQAAAKLQLTGGGNYTIVKLYGLNPATDPNQNNTNPYKYNYDFVYEPDLQHLHEIEIDSDGNNLFVLSAHWLNSNNWILMYDEAAGNDSEVRVCLNDPCDDEPDVLAPTAMVVSSLDDKLYVASTASGPNDEPNDLATGVFCFSIDKAGDKATGLTYETFLDINCPEPNLCDDGLCDANLGFVSAITSMTENTDDGTLYVTGFTAPRFPAEANLLYAQFNDSIFTTPMLAVLAPDTNELVQAIKITDCNLVLPLSIVFTGSLNCAAADVSGDYDVDFEDFASLALHWLESDCIHSGWCYGADVNKSNAVDWEDVAILARFWLETGCVN